MEKSLEKLKGYPLSGNQMTTAIAEPIKIHNVNTLRQNGVFHIDELLLGGKCILFMPTEPNMKLGHWGCMIKNAGDVVIWEPYAFPLKSMTKNLKSNIPIDIAWLADRVKSDGYRLKQNTVRYQDRNDPDEMTCGRYVILRLCFSHLNQREFDKYIKDFTAEYKISPMSLSILLSNEKLT
jgi:hypothetical protein